MTVSSKKYQAISINYELMKIQTDSSKVKSKLWAPHRQSENASHWNPFVDIYFVNQGEYNEERFTHAALTIIMIMCV